MAQWGWCKLGVFAWRVANGKGSKMFWATSSNPAKFQITECG